MTHPQRGAKKKRSLVLSFFLSFFLILPTLLCLLTYSQSVWPDWEIFESSRSHICFQKKAKNLVTCWAVSKTSLFELKLLGYFLDNFWKIELICLHHLVPLQSRSTHNIGTRMLYYSTQLLHTICLCRYKPLVYLCLTSSGQSYTTTHECNLRLSSCTD